MHRTTVMAHLDRSGLERRPLGPKLTGPRLARAIELYESGLSLQAIGNEFGVDSGTVRRALRGADIAICKRRGWQPCSGLPDELLVPVPAATVVCGRVPPPIVTVATSIVPRRHDRIRACATSWLLLNAVRLLATGTPAAACGGRDVNSQACPTDGVGRARCPRSLR